MRNRAKCKLCQEILESFHRYDFVTCKCGEISIDGGPDGLHCGARDWRNFLRVDDNGNEIIVQTKEVDAKEEVEEKKSEEPQKMTKKELIEMLDSMVKNIESLPKNAMDSFINHYDLYSYIALITSILKIKEE